MPVSKDLKAAIGRIDAAIAGGDTWTRVELGRLRQELDLVAADAATDEARAGAVEQIFAELGDGLERGIEGLQRLERRARQGAGR